MNVSEGNWEQSAALFAVITKDLLYKRHLLAESEIVSFSPPAVSVTHADVLCGIISQG